MASRKFYLTNLGTNMLGWFERPWTWSYFSEISCNDIYTNLLNLAFADATFLLSLMKY